jgi:chemotaxis protein MotA
MDWASLAGLALALAGVISGRLLDGGHLGSLLQPAAFAVVAAGTCGAVLLQSGLPTFMRGVRMARWIVVPPKNDLEEMTSEVMAWSALARREGLLSLERHLGVMPDPFMAKGLRMAIDGVDPGTIRDILDVEIATYERRQRQGIKIWESAGGYAPTIGILGAVLGLIHVMENLSDPAKLGSGIAVAFVATLYGVGLANLLFLPVANRLKAMVASEVARRDMMADVFSGIASGENARVIEERLSAYG